MTLNVDSWIANALGKEARISHFDCKIFGGKTVNLKENFKVAIKKKFGENFLEDADYIVIFKGKALSDKDALKKLFALTDRALGKNANSLALADFKIMTKDIEPDVDDEDLDNDELDDDTQDDSVELIDFVFVKITLN